LIKIRLSKTQGMLIGFLFGKVVKLGVDDVVVIVDFSQ
jgi:hypothetical protein